MTIIINGREVENAELRLISIAQLDDKMILSLRTANEDKAKKPVQNVAMK